MPAFVLAHARNRRAGRTAFYRLILVDSELERLEEVTSGAKSFIASQPWTRTRLTPPVAQLGRRSCVEHSSVQAHQGVRTCGMIHEPQRWKYRKVGWKQPVEEREANLAVVEP